MKKFLLTMTALAGLAAVAPAPAQYVTSNTQVWSGVDIHNRIAALENRLDAGMQSGAINGSEESNLRVQLDNLRRLEAQYDDNGLTWQERRDLQTRILATQDQFQYASNGRYGNGVNGQGRALTSAQFRDRIYRLELRLNAGIQAGVISRNEELNLRRQLVDLRRLERQYSYNGLTWQEQQDLQVRLRSARQNISFADNGRYENDSRYSWYDQGYMGSGGPIEETDACTDRGGLAGVLNSLIGRSCYRIGDRVTRNMYTVPYQYRGQYRDTGDVYYRYDGNLIYAIDARTNRVIGSWDAD